MQSRFACEPQELAADIARYGRTLGQLFMASPPIPALLSPTCLQFELDGIRGNRSNTSDSRTDRETPYRIHTADS